MKGLKNIYHKFNEASFHFTGMKPWSRGYEEYKINQIKRTLSANLFHADKLPPNYGYRLDERIVEYPWFFSRLPINVTGKLLDAGSVLNFDFLLKHEALHAKKVFISTLAPEHICYWREGISYVYEDLRDSCFKDNYFDWIVCLSTIEHIGLDNTMLYTYDKSKNENEGSSCLVAVSEYKRMLKPGGTLYLSFPFGKHKNHGWFQIFDVPMLDQIKEVFGASRVKEFYYKYEPAGWKVSSKEESKEATCFDIHAHKSYDKDFAAASRAIACMELIK